MLIRFLNVCALLLRGLLLAQDQSALGCKPLATTTVELHLDPAGRSLLSADRGRLSASLTILKSSPVSSQTCTGIVHLVEQKVVKGKK